MKRLVSAFACVVAVVLAAPRAGAQTGSISGKVLDQADVPIQGATVRLTLPENAGLVYKGQTNKKGAYIILTGQTSGPWRLTISKDGYTPYECPDLVQVRLGDAPTLFPTVKLWEKDTAGAPAKLTKEEVGKIEQQRQAFVPVEAAFKAAVQLVEEAIAAHKAGDPATRDQKLAEAETAYRALAEKAPDIAEIHYNLGVVCKMEQKWPEAAAAYVKAVGIQPGMLEAYQGAAECFQRASQKEQAEAILQQGIAAHPESAQLQLQLGRILWYNGSLPPASAALAKAQELDPADPEPLFYLGNIAVGEGRAADCVRLLEKYLAMTPTNQENVAAARDLIKALKK